MSRSAALAARRDSRIYWDDSYRTGNTVNKHLIGKDSPERADRLLRLLRADALAGRGHFAATP
ncbi:MAG: hypothetical protein WCC57_10715 [Paracoccaceae bacterium]